MTMCHFREIGNRLLFFRKRMGMTQMEVAEAAGMSDRTYADIERGTVNMRLDTLLRICKVLHVMPDEILMAPKAEEPFALSMMVERLNACCEKDRQTALNLLDVFLRSCGK